MAHAPENTALSLVTAEQLGVDEVEFDVRVSSDGVAVISHDDHLGRVLGAEDAPSVSASTWAQLQALQLPRGQRLLTFAEGLELTQADLQVEVKAASAAAVVAEVLADYPDEQRRCMLTSFQVPILAELQHLLPDLPRGVIADAYTDEVRQAAASVKATTVLTGWDGLTPKVVEELHAGGLRVAVWPVRDQQDADRAVELGVDMITADAPAAARDWLDASTA